MKIGFNPVYNGMNLVRSSNANTDDGVIGKEVQDGVFDIQPKERRILARCH
jgi:hypothetical protein